MLIGITASLAGAFCQAVNYIVTQKCQQSFQIGGIKLLIAIHAGMGVIALVPAILLGYWQYLDFGQWLQLLEINIPYLLAQFFLITAIRISDASVVSPLLTLKVPTLAVLSIFLFGASYSWSQWGAIALILLVAYFLSQLAGKMEIKPMLLLIGASLGYGLSDMAITDFSRQIADVPVGQQVLITITINYLFCGLCSIPLMSFFRVPVMAVYQTRWVALTWFVAVIFLVVGFSLSGVVSGNVVQSLRGVIGVVLAYVFFRHQIKQSRSVWNQKLGAAFMMFVAVALFYL